MVGKKAIITVPSTDMTKYVDLKCCFCIPLKLVCFTLGYLMLIMYTFNCVVFAAVIFGAWINRYSEAQTLNENNEAVWDMYILTEHYIIILIAGFSILINITWGVCNIYMLVGLHKKRPSSTKLYTAIGIVQFLLTVLVYCVFAFNIISLIVVALEINFTVLFIKAYQSYAALLVYKRKMWIHTIESILPQIMVKDFFAHPKVVNKQNLIENEKY